MSAELVWCEPPNAVTSGPTKGHKQTKWADILAPMMDRPGQWARVAVRKTSAAAACCAQDIRKGHIGGFEPGEFEAVSRLIDGENGREYGVWARYVGGAK
jgi:hypothetical protein